MFDHMIELILFFAPGILTELLFCRLKERNTDRWLKIGRVLIFSMLCLMARCIISVARGYGDMEVSAIFDSIDNFFKYCILAATEIVVLPPCLLILEKILVHFQSAAYFAGEISDEASPRVTQDKSSADKHNTRDG